MSDVQAPSGPPVAGDVSDSSSITPADYKKIAAAMGKPEGIDFRYGPASTIGDEGLSKYHQPSSKPLGSIPQNPTGFGSWQVGGPYSSNGGPYYSNMANTAFVADNPAQHLGVSVFQAVAAGNNIFMQRPQISWIYQDGINDPNVSGYKQAGLDVGNPVALGRCAGRPGWCVESIVAFQNGLIGTARGSNTALNASTAQLESGLVPTAVALTNSGEFALVTVWDPANLRARVAVIALASLCNNCTPAEPAKEPFWGDWRAAYPGLPNLGNYAFMKVIGYVDLPDMKAPTEISVTTGWNPWTNRTSPDPVDLTLSDEGKRQTFITGVNKDKMPKAGVAVVISKSEKKATFIDLKPLFAYYNRMYFGNRADFDKTAAVGLAANQWPFPFSAAPEQMPTVIKTVGFNARPTAVKTSRGTPTAPDRHAGRPAHIYALGNYLSGGAASPDGIVETGVAVGKNPTGLAYSRQTVHDSGNNDINTKLIVVSRAERKVQWVDFSADLNSGTIVRTLQDANLRDPIAADDNEANGSSAPVLTLSDYNGRAISNYRYGPLVLNPGFAACQGTSCPTVNESGGPAPFEHGGSLQLPGKPFAVTGANVP
ncbi:MAG: hypothetical protein WKG52_11435 [Variovorax sp.]